jgi:hypothetical protein
MKFVKMKRYNLHQTNIRNCTSTTKTPNNTIQGKCYTISTPKKSHSSSIETHKTKDSLMLRLNWLRFVERRTEDNNNLKKIEVGLPIGLLDIRDPLEDPIHVGKVTFWKIQGA